MINTRLGGEYVRYAPLGPGGDPQLSLQGASYGDYGNVVSLSGKRRGLGEVIRWSRLGPGGDPMMSLQGTGCVGCGPTKSLKGAGCLGCGPKSLKGLGCSDCDGGCVGCLGGLGAIDPTSWQGMAIGAVATGAALGLGVGIYNTVAKRMGWA